MYNLIIQNNGSREFFVIRNLKNVSTNDLYLRFQGVDLPEGVVDGEYTYAVFTSDGDDYEIEPKTPILDTILTADDTSITLRDLTPIMGLMRVGKVEDSNVYDEKENNTTFYYEG